MTAIRSTLYLKIIFLAFCVLGAGFCNCTQEKNETSTPMPSATPTLQPAPDFTLTDLNGKSGKLSDYRGKIVILDFWATWCGPCRMLIPHFADLYKRYKGSGLEIVGVAMDQGGAKVVKPFVEKHSMDYPNFIGNNQVAMLYGGLRGIPTTFLITRDGRIYKKYVGVPPNPLVTFENDIKSLLSAR